MKRLYIFPNRVLIHHQHPVFYSLSSPFGYTVPSSHPSLISNCLLHSVRRTPMLPIRRCRHLFVHFRHTRIACSCRCCSASHSRSRHSCQNQPSCSDKCRRGVRQIPKCCYFAGSARHSRHFHSPSPVPNPKRKPKISLCS